MKIGKYLAHFYEFSQNELFGILSEPSRAELFGQKLEPKTSQNEPSLGSDATLLATHISSLLVSVISYRHGKIGKSD